MNRLAVGGEPHDLVFLAEFAEPYELAQRRVKKSERMRHRDAIEDFDFIFPATRGHRRGEIAGTVVRKSRRLVEVARKIRAGDVREMMFDARDLKPAIRFVRAANFGDHLLDAPHFAAPLKMRQPAARGFER